jgi:hypothetical protein
MKGRLRMTWSWKPITPDEELADDRIPAPLAIERATRIRIGEDPPQPRRPWP